MTQAAVPCYLGDDFTQASPGLRFGLLFAGWQTDWSADKTGKTDALQKVLSLSDDCTQRLAALLSRQSALTAAAGASCLRLDAISTAPFVTGTGMEHPLENGFAFLNPYGLPYLPGSSVKGVLRRAAQDMAGVHTEYAYPNPAGWCADDINALFGKETESRDSETQRNRGALQCWDVLPQMPDDALAIEVMTPHFADYYQGKSTPADCESPNPIPFLVVPAGSRFTFHVFCDVARLSPDLAERWQSLLNAAFVHAFDWLGFGAKTRVGYGQLAEDPEIAAARATAAKQQARAEAERLEAAKPAEQRTIENLQRELDAAKMLRGKQAAGSQLGQIFSDTAKAALEWAPDWRQQALPLLHEISRHWLDGNEKNRRKKYLDPLRDGD